MSQSGSYQSPSGVQIARDFRDNLIIDRYDPVFASMRASKRKHLHSANSEDAVTWNVFRSLRQIHAAVWLPKLFAAAFPNLERPATASAVVNLWQTVAPPASLTIEADEGESEIDVVIEAPEWIWFVEAKLGSDISPGTTTRKDRNQVLRNIDVGTYYAGVRPFYFSLLVADEKRSSLGASVVEEYASLTRPRELLQKHRPDGLANLSGISLLRWQDLAEVLAAAAAAPVTGEDERGYAERAVRWLQTRRIAAVAPTPTA